MATANIFNIQSFSTNDGPGIRTVVFFQGCNLHCLWCHNPESRFDNPLAAFIAEKCIACGACHGKCSLRSAGTCQNCGKCADICFAGAITRPCREFTPQQLWALLAVDKPYFDNGNGGVTFSGGEATVQHDFLLALLIESKKNGLHTCLETNGVVSHAKLRGLCDYVDLFLLDFKHSDDQLHKKYTGSSNKPVYGSLELLNQLKQDIILRCPIIPGINDNEAHFAEIKRIHQCYSSIQKVELMPYHEYGVSKWGNVGLTYKLPQVSAPSKEQIAEWNDFVNT